MVTKHIQRMEVNLYEVQLGDYLVIDFGITEEPDSVLSSPIVELDNRSTFVIAKTEQGKTYYLEDFHVSIGRVIYVSP